MIRSHTFLRLTSCMLLLLLRCSSGKSRLQVAQQGMLDGDGASGQTALLLEAVRTGILGSLGMDEAPRLTEKASEEELRRMYRLYWEKIKEIRGNTTFPEMETEKSSVSTVLLPGRVEQLNVSRRRQHPQSGQRTHWFRAVFQRDLNIRTEQRFTRAELKISRQSSGEPEVKQVRVKVGGMKPLSSAAWIKPDSLTQSKGPNFQHVVLDVSPAVETWVRTGGQPLVVDVGLVVVNKETLNRDPTFSLELNLVQSKPARRPTRLRRSSKEDDCDERGWCCRSSVTVSFKDIGWADWVVAPEEYTMHFCDGSCPHNYKPASMHTQVKSRLHQITKGGTPRPCCVPAAYEPMVIMHYDSRGKLKLTPFDDFIVTKCHCA